MSMILTINPGSTSTKIAVFENKNEIFAKNIKHTTEELKNFNKIADQFDFRKEIIIQELKKNNIDLADIKIVMGRGGLIKPVPSGVIVVNSKLENDLINAKREHASNLGGLIASDIAKTIGNGVKAYIADPVVVDELCDLARISGHPLFTRNSVFHALNQKATARKYATDISKKYEDLNLIVVHLGGGISVGSHQKGKVIDVNQALDGEGPFSPERSGTLPAGDLVKLAFSGKYTHEDMKKIIKGEGGYAAYLGTNNAKEVSERAQSGSKEAALIQDAMIYQVSKEIGALSTSLFGKVDAILITGGIAHDKYFTRSIEDRVKFIAPVYIYPGEDEMEALAMNGELVLKGDITPLEYK